VTNDLNADGHAAAVTTFVRNKYFYGKLLDVLHFELEQDYFNGKRWLLNRLVTGYGVICGLDVQGSKDNSSVWVAPGVAIDKWGRELIVPRSCQVAIPTATPPAKPGDPCDAEYVHVCLCYHECEADPAPALGGDCDQHAMCSPGSIRERYELIVRPGKLPDVTVDCSVPDLISGTKINYPALTDYVSSNCPGGPEDSCIPLANVELLLPPATTLNINIAVRPIVFTNDLLHDLLVCLTRPAGSEQTRGGKN
jgi:hypothetical protein